ncbi:MAG: hypothetical protein ACYS74_07445 [Planctomycetota bacterium]
MKAVIYWRLSLLSNLRHNIRAGKSQIQNSPPDFSVVLDQLDQNFGHLILAHIIQNNRFRMLFLKAHNLTSSARTNGDGNQSRLSY